MPMISNWTPDDTSQPPLPPTPRRTRPAVAWGTWAILLVALLLGGYFRTIALATWDEPSFRLHPDERFMLMVASDIHLPASFSEYLNSSISPMNPRNRGHSLYVYGFLPQLLTRTTAVLLTPNSKLPKTVADPRFQDAQQAPQIANPELNVPKPALLQRWLNPDDVNMTDFYQIHKIGRAYSTLFDMGAILLTFLIGRRLFGRRVGAFAALFYALSVLPIQLSHFFTVDTATGFCVLLAIYYAVRISRDGGFGSYVGLGVGIGMSMACRITMAVLGLIGGLAVLQMLWNEYQRRKREPEYVVPDRFTAYPLVAFALLAMAGVISVITFRLLQPDAFLGTSFFDLRPDQRFISNIIEIGKYVSGEAESPPSDQWANRVPYLFPLVNMILWGMGTPLGLAAWIGWAAAGWQLLRRRVLVPLLPWISITLYMLWQGGISNPTLRYFIMLYGLLVIFAAWLLVRMVERSSELLSWAQAKSPIERIKVGFPRLLLAVVVLGSVCWAYAFTRIYTRPHSRITASRWIYQHIPAGATISSEQWDDGLPLNLDDRDSGQYRGIAMSPYLEDDQVKYTGYTGADGKYNEGLFDQLDQLDYIILSSNRVYDSATRMPMRFPVLTRYYHSLFNGDLGFELVADIGSYPTLFGIPIYDQGAEEAFSVYDHPRVLIFKKTAAYSRARAEELLTSDVAWDEVYKLPVIKVSKMPTALRLTDSQWTEYRESGTWAKLFDPSSLANKVPWLFWLLALELLGAALFPILFWLLPSLPDRGFALAKMLALLLVGYAAWLLGSLNLLGFTPGTIWLCAAPLIAIGALLWYRKWPELRAFLRQRRAALISAETLFLVAFFGFVIMRAINPDLWHDARGGEKPMDLAFLTAVLKSPAFPPYDPWYAGGYINYYYFGFVLVGVLVHMTGIVPTVAYNLAVPTIFALTALGAWGVAYNLIALRATIGKAAATAHAWLAHERRAIASGIAAAIFVVLVGSLANAFWLLPGSAASIPSGESDRCPQSSYAARESCKGRREWAFWDATRLVSLSLSTPENNDSTITEFPYFTFLYGDLHAHMLALPLALAALGLMVALVKAKRRQRPDWPTIIAGLCWLGLVLGALRATNTWDFPAYTGLGVLTLALMGWEQWRRGTRLPKVLWQLAASAVALFLISTVLFLPFTRAFATDYAGFQLWHSMHPLEFYREQPQGWLLFLRDIYQWLALSSIHTLASDYLKLHGLWLFMLGSATLALYKRIYRMRILHLLLLAAALLIAIGVVASRQIALVLIVPLAGLSIGLMIEMLAQRPTVQPEPAEDLLLQSLGQADVAVDVSDAIEDVDLDIEPLSESALEHDGALLSEPAADAEIEQAPLADQILEPTPLLSSAPAAAPAPAATIGRFGASTLLPAIWAFSALWLTLLVEIVVARGDIGRMNTVFKFGMQSWVLFAVPSAIAFVWLWELFAGQAWFKRSYTWIWRLLTRQVSLSNAISLQKIGGWLWCGAAVLIVLAALAYPITATPARLADRYDASVGITLDGAAYMRSSKAGWDENGQHFQFREDAAAIDWIHQNVRGTPIMLEAQTEAYRWGGRISIYTGLPTLLGWPGHERQQRAVAQVDPILNSRRQLITTLYNSPSPTETLQLLRLYGVEYIYVGQLERALYDASGLAKFEAMVADGQLVRVYSQGKTSIYQSLPNASPPALLTTSLKVGTPAPQVAKSLQIDRPLDLLPVIDEYAWNQIAQSQPVAVLFWLLAWYALLLLGLPVATLVFGRAGSGSASSYVWARLIGLLLLGYAVWMPVSAKLWQYSRPGVWIGVALVLALDALVLAWLGWWAAKRDAAPLTPASVLASGVRALGADLRARRHQILISEALFLALFAAMLVVRMFNPDLWQPIYGGEKPFEFGFLNAILRSPTLPPYDPFFSGGTINYYYYGFFLLSLPMKATGINPAIGFNLALATLYAITAMGAFTLVQRLTGKIRYGLAGAAFLALLGNLAAVFPAGSSPGIAPALQVLATNMANFGQRMGDWFWLPSRVIITDQLNTINEFPYWSFLFADLHPHLIALPIGVLAIAIIYELFANRADTPTAAGESTGLPLGPRAALLGSAGMAALALGALAITNSWDFPTYTLLLGGALVGRAWRWPSATLRLWRSGLAERGAGDGLRAAPVAEEPGGAADEPLFETPAEAFAANIGEQPELAPSSAGSIAPPLLAAEEQSAPAYAALPPSDNGAAPEGNPAEPVPIEIAAEAEVAPDGFAAEAAPPSDNGAAPEDLPDDEAAPEIAAAPIARPAPRWQQHPPLYMRVIDRYAIRMHMLGAILLTAAIAGSALLLYLPFFQNFQAVVHGIGRVEQGSPLRLYLMVNGLFLLVLVPMMLVANWRLRSYELLMERDTGWGQLRQFVVIIAILMLVVGVLVAPEMGLKLVLATLVVLGVGLLLPRQTRPATWFLAWMMVVGLMVSLGVEIIYIRDHLDGGSSERMNTVFKFGYQIWVLFAIAAAAALPALMRWLRKIGGTPGAFTGAALLVIIVGLGLAYPLIGTPSRLAMRFPDKPGLTLDGLAFMDSATFSVSPSDIGQADNGLPIVLDLKGDAAAIRWINQNITGTPIILQSDLWFYRTYGIRIAANTGFPTIVSPLHASEQHDGDQVAERDNDVQAIYRTIDPRQALQLLSKYRVGYVYVGAIERAAYGDAGVDKFDQMIEYGIEQVYSYDGVKIYKVNEAVYRIAAPAQGTSLQPVEAPKPAETPPSDEQPALEQLERQVQANPTVASLAFGLGQRYYANGRLDDAISVLTPAAEANPNDVALHQLLGDVLRDNGLSDDAEKAYQEAVDAKPDAGNYNKLGMHQINMDALDRATDSFQKAIAADPTAPDPYFHMGEIYEKEGKRAEAIAEYQKYLEIAPSDGALRSLATEALNRLK